jgi:hypothetical protein
MAFPEVNSLRLTPEIFSVNPYQIDQRVSLEEWANALSKFGILSISIGNFLSPNAPSRSPVMEAEFRWPPRSNSLRSRTSASNLTSEPHCKDSSCTERDLGADQGIPVAFAAWMRHLAGRGLRLLVLPTAITTTLGGRNASRMLLAELSRKWVSFAPFAGPDRGGH